MATAKGAHVQPFLSTKHKPCKQPQSLLAVSWQKSFSRKYRTCCQAQRLGAQQRDCVGRAAG